MTIQASNNEDDFETMRTDTLRSIASAIADRKRLAPWFLRQSPTCGASSR